MALDRIAASMRITRGALRRLILTEVVRTGDREIGIDEDPSVEADIVSLYVVITGLRQSGPDEDDETYQDFRRQVLDVCRKFAKAYGDGSSAMKPSYEEAEQLLYDYVAARRKPKTRARLHKKMQELVKQLAGAPAGDPDLMLQYATDTRQMDDESGNWDAALEELGRLYGRAP